jgi:hypothetical protein
MTRHAMGEVSDNSRKYTFTRSWNFHNLVAEQPLPGQAVWQAVRTANNIQAGQDCGPRAKRTRGERTLRVKLEFIDTQNKTMKILSCVVLHGIQFFFLYSTEY